MRQVEDGCVYVSVRPVPSMALLCPAKVRSTPLGHSRTLRTSRPEEVSRGLPLAFSTRARSPFSIFLASSCLPRRFHLPVSRSQAVRRLNKYLNAGGSWRHPLPPSLSLPVFAQDPMLLPLATFCLRSRPRARVTRQRHDEEGTHRAKNEFP